MDICEDVRKKRSLTSASSLFLPKKEKLGKGRVLQQGRIIQMLLINLSVSASTSVKAEVLTVFCFETLRCVLTQYRVEKSIDLRETTAGPWNIVGLDIVGPFERAAPVCSFAATLTDYYSKWSEHFDATVHICCFCLISVKPRYIS